MVEVFVAVGNNVLSFKLVALVMKSDIQALPVDKLKESWMVFPG